MTLEPSNIQDPGDEELEEQARAVAPHVLAYIQQHWHAPLQMPPTEDLRELREFDPELYKTWMGLVKDQHRHDLWMEKAPFEVPSRIARRGQWFGLAAVLAVLGLAGWMVAKGESGWGALIAGIDIVTLAAVFARPVKDNPPSDHEPRH